MTQQPHHIFVEEAAEICGLDRDNFYARVKQSRAPQPVGKVGKRNVWDRAKIEAYAAHPPQRVTPGGNDFTFLRSFVERLADQTLEQVEKRFDLADAQQLLDEAVDILAEYPTNPVTEQLVRVWRRILEERAT